jgi:putative transposase
LAQQTLAHARGWGANCTNPRVRINTELDQAKQEIALLQEQLRINQTRMESIPPNRRPNYRPHERMAILQLKAARSWSLEQTAEAFLVTAATIASWMKRLDEDGPDALIQLPIPVNKFPEFVAYLVQRLKTICPTMGKVKIAQTLARAGLHLGSTTVRRMLKQKPQYEPFTSTGESLPEGPIVTAKYANHVWHIDLTTVPTGGFWTSWFPFMLPQVWPFSHWVAIVVDHFSRRVMGATAFKSQPTCEAVCGFMGRTIAKAGRAPRHIVCDRGKQFDCPAFRKWCKRKGIKNPRYGAVGKKGSIAVVERVILTIKCLLACLPYVPYRREAFLKELLATVEWYNQSRPHTWLGGKTPNEVYFNAFPANRRPRLEPRTCWPRGSPCAKPWALVRGSPGVKLTLEVGFHQGRKHLPIVGLRRVA